MLSYLSSWFLGSSEDPSIIRCKDFILEDSPTENGFEWIWVDVDSNDVNDLDNVLQEYIVVPPFPSVEQNSSTTETAITPQKRTSLHEGNSHKKRRRCLKLKIYPPLKPPSKYVVRRRPMVCNSSKERIRISHLNQQGFSFENIKGLEGFQSGGITAPWDIFYREKFKPKSILEPLPEIPQCTSLSVNKDILNDSWYKVPKSNSYRIDKLDKLIAEGGWSILIDSSGETLSSSMVRVWNIKSESVHQEMLLLLEALCAGSDGHSSYPANTKALLDKPSARRQKRKASGKRRKNRSKTNVLTAKPGHTSLVVEEVQEKMPRDFSFSRGVNSLVHSSKEMLFALQVYLAQILDSVTLSNKSSSVAEYRPRKQQIIIPGCVKRIEKITHKAISRKNGRKNLARWNKTQLHRHKKPVQVHRKGMGRAGVNCSTKRSY